jgi:hypothetical protein
MAFDQHIEADRIDDFNLFSAFVRVPLLILEGVLGNQKQSCDTKDRLDSIDKGKRTSSPPQSPPRVVSDDDLATPQQQYETVSSNVLINRMNQTYAALSRSPSSKSSTDLSSVPTKGLKRTSKMSWSDESGRSLVEYSDEVSLHSFFFLFFFDCLELFLRVCFSCPYGIDWFLVLHLPLIWNGIGMF